MTEEAKTVRTVVMVSTSLLKAIDEYRYKKHIPFRSEAIRELLEKSLKRQHP